MQQLDTQEDLMQDRSVEGGAEDNGAEDDGAEGADATSPMEGDNEPGVEPGPAILAGPPPPAAMSFRLHKVD